MISFRHSFLAIVVIGVLAVLASQACATVITTAAGNGTDATPGTGFTLDQSFLVPTTVTATDFDNNPPFTTGALTDGLLGAPGLDVCEITGNPGHPNAQLVYTFDTSSPSHANGWDITKVATYAGWSTANTGRANQEYSLDVQFMDGTEKRVVSGLFDVNANPTNFWTEVVHTNIGGGALDTGTFVATGVKAVIFSNFAQANAGGPVIWREFDVFGTPTPTPEPGALLLLGTGLLGLLAYAWRRRR